MPNLRSPYHQTMSEATGLTDEADLEEIEDIMRHSIFHSTLDWQTREQLVSAARLAHEILKLERAGVT